MFFILDKLKNKYSKEFNAIKNDNKKYNIKIKIYVKTNNYLKINIILLEILVKENIQHILNIIIK